MSKVISSVMEKKSSKSHGKKSDKETHTPMLKIFKDMMQLEKNDPEKTNLLIEKERPKKKKQYSSSRTKTDYVVNRSCDSSSSERNGDGRQAVEARQYDIHTVKTQSRSKDTTKSKGSKRSKDTSSCGSCARRIAELIPLPRIFKMSGWKRPAPSEPPVQTSRLKRLATSEYACLVCLGVVFTITIVVAFFMVFKTPINIPCPVKKPSTLKPRSIYKGVNYADISFKEGVEEDRNDWDDTHLGRFHEMSDLPGADLDDSSSRGLNFGGSNNQFSDLAKIIDINKLNYGQSSERLKNFYKKLLQADDQIKRLKKGFSDTSITMKNTERIKRSLNHHRFHNEGYNDHYRRRNRRYHRHKINDSLPTSLMIGKKELYVHYPQDETRKLPKCSHMPKESKSHETELKHPFYKYTQRLDELLDQFLDKNLPKMIPDTFGMDILKNHEEKTSTRNKVTRTTAKSHASHVNVKIIEDSFSDRPGFNRDEFFKISTTDKSDSDVILGVTTIMSSPKHHQTKPLVDILPNIRKLMQVYESDEDALGYEDLKEVLADDESSEAPEVKLDRNKRTPDMNSEPNPVFEFSKSNPSGIPIPNWKGPLPLYPDELNTMIKQDYSNKVTGSKNARKAKQLMFNDVEYVEDYLTNKYENLAQAYSDYGVLDEKKPFKIENKKAEKVNVEQGVPDSVDGGASETRKSNKCSKNAMINFQNVFDDNFKFVNEAQVKRSHSSDDNHSFSISKCFKPKEASRKERFFDILKGRSAKNTVIAFQKLFDDHFKFINGSQEKQLHSSDDNSNAIFKYIQPYEASREGIHFGLMKGVSESNNKRDRDLKLEANSTANSVIIKKRNLKSIGEISRILNSDITIKVGSHDDLKGDDNLFTKGYNFGDEESEIKFGTTTPKIETAQINLHSYLFGDVGIRQRSLKSIEIDNADNETVNLNGNITIDDTSAMILTNKAWTLDTYSKETSQDEVDMKTSIYPEVAKKINEPLVINHEITEHISPFKKITVNITPEIYNNSRMNFNIDIDAKKSVMDIVNLVNSRNVTNEAKDGMDLSDLFRMFSTWFKKLSSVSLDNNDNQSETNSSIMVLKSSEAPDSVTVSILKDTTDIIYPNYDSDMIDNIGHRSRVLMSVVEAINASKDDKGNGDTDNDKMKSDMQITNSTDPPNIILTTTKYEKDTNTLEGDKTASGNKTVVKRSLTDSGLVFWSDMYDDEYGVKVDNNEKEIVGKNTPGGKQFMKRSKSWIQDKVKSIAENIKELRSDGMKRDTFDDSHIYKRHAKKETEGTQEKVTSFAELKAKMKNVCRQAAQAVQQTRKMQVRESQEDTAANSIMQQLVRMMSDLVEYQVKQKTCIKLPSDLQNFLEWLTNPDDEARRSNQDAGLIDESMLEKVNDLEAPQTPTVNDEKAEYLESLRSVEELIQQYGQMSDEEKSKMSGVSQYLESQHEFLTKQIALLDELHFSNLYGTQQPIRFKRHLVTETPKLQRNRIKRKLGKRLGKYLRNFGKKSTIIFNFDDATENSKIEVRDVEMKHINDDYDKNNDDFNFIVNNRNTKKKQQGYNNINTEFDTDVRDNKYNIDKEFHDDSKINKGGGNRDMNKRNLQDVYYRALNEAKKVTTEKNSDSSNYKIENL